METNLDTPNEFRGVPANKIIRQNAITLSAIFIIGLVITHFMREQLMEYNNWVSIMYFALMLVFLIFTQTQVREKTNGGIITFSGAFGAGMKFSIWVAIIFAIFNLLFYLVIFPEASGEIVRLAEQSMREKDMPEDQIEMGLKVTAWFVSPLGIFISTLVMYPLMGAILSLVAAAFTQRVKK
ncbi:MAG: DUF4199 domain-containing protein [Chitinophagales bacterium]|nr:DUF4199 domain-containing protein [Chitinophagales bacterium]